MTSEFGDQVAKRRKVLKLTQAKLAEMTGMSQARISNYEAGLIRKPTAKSLRLLSEALQTSVDYLLGQTEIIASPPVR